MLIPKWFCCANVLHYLCCSRLLNTFVNFYISSNQGDEFCPSMMYMFQFNQAFTLQISFINAIHVPSQLFASVHISLISRGLVLLSYLLVILSSRNGLFNSIKSFHIKLLFSSTSWLVDSLVLLQTKYLLYTLISMKYFVPIIF